MSGAIEGFTEAKQLDLIAQMSDEGSAYPDYSLQQLGSTSNGSLVVRATTKEPGEDSIYRFIVPADAGYSDERRVGSISGKHLESQVARQIGSVTVVKRDYIPTLFTAADFIRDSRRHGFNIDSATTFVHRFLNDALIALEAVHAENRVHGDLRPEKFGLNERGEVVLRDVGIRYPGAYKNIRYVAPEILKSENAVEYSQSSDVYAFLCITADLLKPFRGDAENPHLAMLDAQFRWLQDYFYPRKDRPSAAMLRAFVSANGFSVSGAAWDAFFDSFNKNTKRSLRRPSRNSPLGLLKNHLNDYPETRFAIDGSLSGQRLARWFAFDDSFSKRYSPRAVKKNSEKVKAGLLTVPDFNSIDLPTEIDDRWMNALHRSFFGIPIDDQHDARLASGDLSQEESQLRDYYLRSINGANEARAVLLGEHQFLSTAEVVALLKESDTPLDRPELMVLRRWGRILAVPDHGRWLHPSFQFQSGVISPRVHEVHQALRLHREGLDPDPWVELTYWSINRGALGGLALKDVVWLENKRHDVDNVIRNATM